MPDLRSATTPTHIAALHLHNEPCQCSHQRSNEPIILAVNTMCMPCRWVELNFTASCACEAVSGATAPRIMLDLPLTSCEAGANLSTWLLLADSLALLLHCCVRGPRLRSAAQLFVLRNHRLVALATTSRARFGAQLARRRMCAERLLNLNAACHFD